MTLSFVIFDGCPMSFFKHWDANIKRLVGKVFKDDDYFFHDKQTEGFVFKG